MLYTAIYNGDPEAGRIWREKLTAKIMSKRQIRFCMDICCFGPKVVGLFSRIHRMAPTAQERAKRANDIGTRANVSRFSTEIPHGTVTTQRGPAENS